ncbi:holo-ACP synthase [Lacticaseibacillus thailandensis]|uniref:Holo-[acyl-carrier-protein] synthase n=1 Tax=Lacticaseibacillus thailandensis DSM 22698 = JCM 13996 TaxID=1423810 RepID=A0A0R2CE27_9LACO|nr:holo-ACP synthase [Lacticaseibacillus thailandensis]KRM86633.1 Phosphopantetheinyl transferase (holo-ACP synthase) [Lacticaseibacillus thailandensis DSM 22698 = JCM 13996]
MIHGLGVDITDIARVVQAQTRNDHFAVKVLTPAELAQFQAYAGQRAWEYLAGRFSAKEAYSKAYGTGIGTVGWQDIEIIDNDHGRPRVTGPFPGRAHVSISHTHDLVMTEVILEEDK